MSKKAVWKNPLIFQKSFEKSEKKYSEIFVKKNRSEKTKNKTNSIEYVIVTVFFEKVME